MAEESETRKLARLLFELDPEQGDWEDYGYYDMLAAKLVKAGVVIKPF